MGKIEEGYMGGFTGRLGPAVGYRWRGKWCLRAYQKFVNNPRTPAQQAHRMLFKEQVQLAGRLNYVLRKTFDEVSMEYGMTACNFFVSLNQAAFAPQGGVAHHTGDGAGMEVAWSRLRLSVGPVAPVAFGTVEVSHGTVVTVPFERNPLHVSTDAYDSVYLVAYAPELRQVYLSAPVHRRSRVLATDLPEHFAGHEVQLWGMVQDHQDRWSETIYIGGGVLEDGPLCVVEDDDDETFMDVTALAGSAGRNGALAGSAGQGAFVGADTALADSVGQKATHGGGHNDTGPASAVG